MKNLLLGISNANNHLLKEISIDEALNLCITAIGKSQDIDRCYIFKNETENEKVKLFYIYEWCNEGIDSYLGSPDLNGLSYDNFPGLYQPLSNDIPLYGLVKNSDNKLFVETMEMQGIKSYLFTPIFSENKFWGWIGYDDCKTEREWADEEVSALHTVAKNIGIRLNQDQTNAKLEAHLDLFDFYLKGSNQGMWEWNIITNIATFSYNYAGMLGYRLEEIDQNFEFWRKNVHPDEIIQIELDLRDYINGKTNSYGGIKRMKHKQGHYVWIKYSGLAIRNVIGNPIKIIGTHIDISEIKEKERQLELSEEKFRFIAENTTDLITQRYNDGTFSYVSNSSKDIIGYNPEELIHRSPYEFIHPDDLGLMQDSSREIAIKLELIATTYRFRKKDNNYIWLESTSKVILNNKQEIIGIQSSSRDISERINAAEEMRLNLLKEKELSELKTKFVAMASHQFRTPLTIIYSNAELIDIKSKTNLRKDTSYLELNTERIKNEVDRLTELMNNILIYGKYELEETKKDLKEVDFVIFIKNIIETYFNNEIDGRKIKISIKGEKQKISTDETLLIQIVTNIIGNAFKYSAGKPEPELIINYLENKIKLEIIDFGIGIPAKEKQHLFTSFFRATNTSTIVGSGLGLTIAKQFTDLLNGKISIKSRENFGTTITLILPYEQ
ncbi:PAS domain S-box protein [Flavobacterium franklandianum]|uniref:sensor histidine kinase n=1 Tax=Flavobacterium franklandianum TaxID=2594430 RepID=UPI00117A9E5F|nr:PAS domain-containing protein [Flavobacterium franklandianum]TRX24375.1 PAS domain S-box protein [Flavobacterium franklandianum]